MAATDDSIEVVQLYEEGSYGLQDCDCLIRVYLHHQENDDRQIRFPEDLARGDEIACAPASERGARRPPGPYHARPDRARGGMERHPFERDIAFRRTGLRPPADFEADDPSATLPAASQFSTEIEVASPTPLEPR
jgi:hypothetical protein